MNYKLHGTEPWAINFYSILILALQNRQPGISGHLIGTTLINRWREVGGVPCPGYMPCWCVYPGISPDSGPALTPGHIPSWVSTDRHTVYRTAPKDSILGGPGFLCGFNKSSGGLLEMTFYSKCSPCLIFITVVVCAFAVLLLSTVVVDMACESPNTIRTQLCIG